MKIDKQTILDLLTSRGDHDQATRAEADLPAQVDPEQDAALLTQLGMDPADFTGRASSGLGGAGLGGDVQKPGGGSNGLGGQGMAG